MKYKSALEACAIQVRFCEASATYGGLFIYIYIGIYIHVCNIWILLTMFAKSHKNKNMYIDHGKALQHGASPCPSQVSLGH